MFSFVKPNPNYVPGGVENFWVGANERKEVGGAQGGMKEVGGALGGMKEVGGAPGERKEAAGKAGCWSSMAADNGAGVPGPQQRISGQTNAVSAKLKYVFGLDTRIL